MICRYMVSTCVQILMGFVYFTLSYKNCSRYVGGCCPGFEWNSYLENCTECEIGYAGPNCSRQCVYPSYGLKCALECTCSNESCKFSTGCVDETSEPDIHTSAAGALGPNFTVMTLCLSLFAILILLVFGSLKCWKYIKSQSMAKEDVTEENHYQTISDHDLSLKLN